MNGSRESLHQRLTAGVLVGRSARCESLALLCTDHIACRGRDGPESGWRDDGIAGVVADAATRCHRDDLDDLHWPTVTHPGSIVWPVVLALGAHSAASGPTVARAATAGYDMTAAVADLLSASSITRVHRTSIAGHAGSAIAASILLDLGDRTADAVGLALAVAGGVGQTIEERAEAGRFHRAAAAVGGLHAARSARSGLRSPVHVLEGTSGLIAMLGGSVPSDLELRDEPVADETCLRVHPTNGFLQAAFEAIEVLRARSRQPPAEVEVVLHPGAIRALANQSPRWSIASLRPAMNGWGAAHHGQPELTVSEGAVTLGDARVRTKGNAETDDVTISRDFTRTEPIGKSTLGKWQSLGMDDGSQMVERFRAHFADDAPLSLADGMSRHV